MEQSDGVNWVFYIFLTIAALCGVITIKRAFNKPDNDLNLKEMERILREKDKIIESLESRVQQYQKLVSYDSKRSRSELE